ncbi:MAG: cell wall hydrolase [Pseudomonadota bacterium]
MHVPPPYVPRLSENDRAADGPAGFSLPRQKPEPDSRPAPKTPAATRLAIAPAPKTDRLRAPGWLQLSSREKVLLALLILGIILIPVTMPRASLDAREFQPAELDLQPVERPEENFAGSAFYFIDPGYAIPQNYEDLAIDPLAEQGSGLPEATDGLADENLATAHLIRPITFRGSAMDNGRALQCLTSAIYYEAGLESDAGQKAVAQVVLNRVRHPSYPGTVCGVVFQGSERVTGCQFSYTCDGSLRRKPSRFHWKRADKVAAAALAGKIASPVGTATHYHTTEVYPYWAPSLRFLGTIGAHRFYSWKGSAGKANAFSQTYRGREPLPAPKPRSAAVSASGSLDPIALEKAYEQARRKAEQEAARQEKATALAADRARRLRLSPAPADDTRRTYRAPDYSQEALKRGGDKAFAGQKLPSVGQIKPEYRQSGTWKAEPGS